MEMTEEAAELKEVAELTDLENQIFEWFGEGELGDLPWDMDD